MSEFKLPSFKMFKNKDQQPAAEPAVDSEQPTTLNDLMDAPEDPSEAPTLVNQRLQETDATPQPAEEKPEVPEATDLPLTEEDVDVIEEPKDDVATTLKELKDSAAKNADTATEVSDEQLVDDTVIKDNPVKYTEFQRNNAGSPVYNSKGELVQIHEHGSAEDKLRKGEPVKYTEFQRNNAGSPVYNSKGELIQIHGIGDDALKTVSKLSEDISEDEVDTPEALPADDEPEVEDEAEEVLPADDNSLELDLDADNTVENPQQQYGLDEILNDPTILGLDEAETENMVAILRSFQEDPEGINAVEEVLADTNDQLEKSLDKVTELSKEMEKTGEDLDRQMETVKKLREPDTIAVELEEKAVAAENSGDQQKAGFLRRQADRVVNANRLWKKAKERGGRGGGARLPEEAWDVVISESASGDYARTKEKGRKALEAGLTSIGALGVSLFKFGVTVYETFPTVTSAGAGTLKKPFQWFAGTLNGIGGLTRMITASGAAEVLKASVQTEEGQKALIDLGLKPSEVINIENQSSVIVSKTNKQTAILNVIGSGNLSEPMQAKLLHDYDQIQKEIDSLTA